MKISCLTSFYFTHGIHSAQAVTRCPTYCGDAQHFSLFHLLRRDIQKDRTCTLLKSSFYPVDMKKMRQASHHVEVQGSLSYGTNSVPSGETFKSLQSHKLCRFVHIMVQIITKKCKRELFFILHKVKYSVKKKLHRMPEFQNC